MNLLVSRAPALRTLAIAGFLYYGLTSYANSSQQSILTIQDYLGTEIKQKDTFSIIGILKPRSVKLATGLNKKFTITDNKSEIRCSLKTPITTQFKEGQTLIVSGYCPDLSKKNIITVKQFVTKHSMQNREWEARRNVDKKNYGLQSFK